MTQKEVLEIYHTPLLELVFEAAQVHRTHHDPSKVQISSLVSIKTGGCPEDCAYCPQAARYHTGVKATGMMPIDELKQKAEAAKQGGASRICMGAAWRNVEDNEDFDQVIEMVETLNGMGVEVCCTLGMLNRSQAERLSRAGLYAYNHNLDTSEEHYKEIISTRSYQDRIKTIDNVRKSNITVCSGGIIGMGESVDSRCDMLATLSALDPPPESVPINALVAVEGTPLEEQKPISSWEMIRMVATARIALPTSVIRLSAGRTEMNEETQAMCFLAGAGSIFAGEKLLTTPNPDVNQDLQMLDALGLSPTQPYEKGKKPYADMKSSEKEGNEEEATKWERPKHIIPANVAATKRANKLRKEKATQPS